MSTLPPDPVYGMADADKQAYLLREMNRLSSHHYAACAAYRRILDGLGTPPVAQRLDAVPFLPVRLFKRARLQSVPDQEVIKTMTSSGTSGQQVSQIVLDRPTSALQVKALSRIVSDFIGPSRLPLLVLDCQATAARRERFSARTAGILGFSMFGREVAYALDDDMRPDFAAIDAFLARHANQRVLLFGFTYIVWSHWVRALEESGRRLALDQGILIHGGGWKQMEQSAVGPEEFSARLAQVTGIRAVHNYYGMVEQTGSIFMACEAGRLHAPLYSDVLIRDPVDFRVLPDGQSGLIQLFSTLPHSYPGHSLLSEDMGEVTGVDNCPCGRKGRHFRVLGRLAQAETRGCSDTYTG